MKWFKLYGQDFLTDPKMLALTASERSCWITLLCYSSINDNGLITFLTEEQLMFQSGINPNSEEWNETKGLLKKLETLKMIQVDNEQITVLNWQKRQETNLTGYERVKRYRAKKQNDNGDDNTKITSDKNRVEEIRIDKNKKEERENTPSQEAEEFFSNIEKQKSIISYLTEKGIPEQIASREVGKFVMYWTEPDSAGRKQRWQKEKVFDVKRRFVTWMDRAGTFKNQTKEKKGITI